MLHLALSGNLLCALDGVIELYDFRVIPQLPGSILYEKVEMDLNRADQANLTLFKEVPLQSFCNEGFSLTGSIW